MSFGGSGFGSFGQQNNNNASGAPPNIFSTPAPTNGSGAAPGAPGTTATGGSLFGGSSAFGQNVTTTPTSTPPQPGAKPTSIFGSSFSSSGASGFGRGTAFGNGAGAGSGGQGGGLFGQTSAANSSATPSGNPASNSALGGFSAFSKPSVFGLASAVGSNDVSSNSGGANTGGVVSTTSAGTPAPTATGGFGGFGAFGSLRATPSGTSAAEPTTGTPAATTAPSSDPPKPASFLTGSLGGFGSFNSQPASGSTATPAASSGNLFGSLGSFGATAPKAVDNTGTTPSNATAGLNLFSKPTSTPGTAPTGGNLFGNLGSTSASAASSAPSVAPLGDGGAPSVSATTSGSTAPNASGINLFAAPSKLAEPVGITSSMTGAGAGGSLFGQFRAQPQTSTTSAENKPAATTEGKDNNNNTAPSTLSGLGDSGAGPAAGAASGAAPSIFGSTLGAKKPEGDVKATANAAASSSTPDTSPPAPGAATSSADPAPSTSAAPPAPRPPPSLLKGKTLDEILVKWNGELDTQTKEFTRMANEVAVWDRALMENSEKMNFLYDKIAAAVASQTSVEDSLKHIEEQQAALSRTLDSYEAQTKAILNTQGRQLDLGPANRERDNSYGLASNLNSQLDDLALSLTSMIDLVNGLSANNSATDASMAQPFGGNGNDPIGQIEAILNAHLGSLQWIDGAVKELEEKIRDAETKNAQRQQRHGGYEGSGTGSPTSSVYGGDGGARRGFGLGPVRR